MKLNLNYYDINAVEFFESTFQIDMESLYQSFLRYLPNNALILDLGCGSGRDTLAFKNKGYQVDAIDYSEKLVRKATELTGIKVRHQSFYDLSDIDRYDGVPIKKIDMKLFVRLPSEVYVFILISFKLCCFLLNVDNDSIDLLRK